MEYQGGNIRGTLLRVGLAMLLLSIIPKPVLALADRQLNKSEQQVAVSTKTPDAPQPIQERPQEAVTPTPVEEPKPEPVAPAPEPAPVAIPSSKEELMRAAGIPERDFAAVDYIVTKESTWRPHAVNSSSGATGLCQALPASKMASAGADYLTNPVTQLRWCHQYAQSRYGSWASSFAFWQANRWW